MFTVPRICGVPSSSVARARVELYRSHVLSAFCRQNTIVNSSAQTNVGGSDRPNVIGDPDLPSSERTLQRWFNTSAFALQPQFTPGNVGVGTMHGPSQRRIDLSLSKSMRQTGSQTVQVRVEVYNITNKPNFQPPDGNFGSTTFGSISSTGNAIPRQMQFALKYLF